MLCLYNYVVQYIIYRKCQKLHERNKSFTVLWMFGESQKFPDKCSVAAMAFFDTFNTDQANTIIGFLHLDDSQ